MYNKFISIYLDVYTYFLALFYLLIAIWRNLACPNFNFFSWHLHQSGIWYHKGGGGGGAQNRVRSISVQSCKIWKTWDFCLALWDHSGICQKCTHTNRFVAQIPQRTSPTPHNAPLCRINMHPCANFCYEVVHYIIFVQCVVGVERWVYFLYRKAFSEERVIGIHSVT